SPSADGRPLLSEARQARVEGLASRGGGFVRESAFELVDVVADSRHVVGVLDAVEIDFDVHPGAPESCAQQLEADLSVARGGGVTQRQDDDALFGGGGAGAHDVE